jgi:hypothetical protein
MFVGCTNESDGPHAARRPRTLDSLTRWHRCKLQVPSKDSSLFCVKKSFVNKTLLCQKFRPSKISSHVVSAIVVIVKDLVKNWMGTEYKLPDFVNGTIKYKIAFYKAFLLSFFSPKNLTTTIIDCINFLC